MLGIKTPAQVSAMREESSSAMAFDLMEEEKPIAKTLLAQKILKSWSASKSNKTRVEHSMLQCLRDRKGEYSPEDAAIIAEAGGSDIFIRTATGKVRAGIAHMKSILMPASEKAYGIEPTSRPKIPPFIEKAIVARILSNPNFVDENGAPMAPEDQARMLEERAKELIKQKAKLAARKHEELIFDQLQEGGWYEALSDLLDDINTYPVCFMKGPFKANKPILRFEHTEHGIIPVSGMKVVNSFRSMNPFDSYWAPGASDIQKGDFIERLRLNPSDLYDMIGVDGYNEEAIRNVLRLHGQNGIRNWLWTDSARMQIAEHLHWWQQSTTEIDGLHWYGKAQGLELLEAGVNPNDIDDPLKTYDIDAIYIAGEVIRAVVNPDPLYRRPVHSTCYEKVPGNVAGNSPSMLMDSSGRMINATARALQNNLAHSSGFQMEVDYTRLAPETDAFDVHPFKVWQARESEMSGDRPAVRFFQPQSNAQELMAVIDKFERTADKDTGIPQFFQGSEGTGQGADATAKGRAMLADQSTKLLRLGIVNIDVDIIIPKLKMLYDYNMLNHPDESVKGDAEIVARGANAMLMRDSSRASHMAMLELTNNPDDRQIMGVEGRAKLLKAVLDTYPDIEDTIIPSDEDIEAKARQIESAPPPPDPAIVKVEAQQQTEQAKLEFEQQKHQSEMNQRNAELDHQRQLEMMKLAAQRNQQTDNTADLAKIEAQAQLEVRKQDLNLQLEREKMEMNRQLKKDEIAENIKLQLRTAAMANQTAEKQQAQQPAEVEIDQEALVSNIVAQVLKETSGLTDDIAKSVDEIKSMVEKDSSALGQSGQLVFHFNHDGQVTSKEFNVTRDNNGNLKGTVTPKEGK